MGFTNQWTNKRHHHYHLVSIGCFSMLSTYNHCKYNLQNPVCNIKQDLILSQNKIRMLVVQAFVHKF